MHTVFALLCFVVVIHWLIFPYPSGLLHWHCGNLTIAPVPAKQPWWIWINTSCEFIMNNCITTTKQSTTKPCAYFLGYTVCAMYHSYQMSVECIYRMQTWWYRMKSWTTLCLPISSVGTVLTVFFYLPVSLVIIPRFNEVERGVYWFHLVCLSVRLSVCGQNLVRSESSTILVGSMWYLHILSSNFIRCVTCNVIRFWRIL